MPSDKSNILAVCQHPDGPGDYVPHASETCFMDCDCKPRQYVAVDALREWMGEQSGPTVWALRAWLDAAETGKPTDG